MTEQRVMKISHLRDNLGWACQEVSLTEEPIIVQRYRHKDVAIVPLWEGQFLKQVEADIRSGKRPWEENQLMWLLMSILYSGVVGDEMDVAADGFFEEF